MPLFLRSFATLSLSTSPNSLHLTQLAPPCPLAFLGPPATLETATPPPLLPKLQFGVPLYGGTMTGSVLFVRETRLGCSEFAAPLPAGGALPPVLLVDRGGAGTSSFTSFMWPARWLI